MQSHLGKIHVSSADICVLACSPRQGGNSDYAAQLFVQGLQAKCSALKVNTPSIQTLYLREFTISPCIGCNVCFSLESCIYSQKDEAECLFSCIKNAKHVFLTAPIFFYHVPAIAKAFMDRGQQYYAKRMQQGNLENEQGTLNCKSASVALVAARKQGDNLFKGTLWSLHYFFDVFPIKITKSLLLPGFDAQDDLARNEAACTQINMHGKEIAQQFFKSAVNTSEN